MRVHGHLLKIITHIQVSTMRVQLALPVAPQGLPPSAHTSQGLLGDEGGHTKPGISVWSHDPIMRSRGPFTGADGAPQ